MNIAIDYPDKLMEHSKRKLYSIVSEIPISTWLSDDEEFFEIIDGVWDVNSVSDMALHMTLLSLKRCLNETLIRLHYTYADEIDLSVVSLTDQVIIVSINRNKVW